MPDWLFVVVPLLVVPVVLLFAFAGCSFTHGTLSVMESPYPDAIDGEPSLVSYWRLGEATGNVAVDAKGGLNGAYSAAGVTLDQEGAIVPKDPGDKSVDFDGASGLVEVPFNAALNPTSFSVEAWVNPTSITQAGTVLSSAQVEGNVLRGFALGMNNGQWALVVGDGVAGNPFQTLTAPVVASEMLGGWRHVVMTYDGASTAKTLRLYVNSADGARAGELTGVNYAANAGAPLRIAASGAATPAFFFAGRLDEVAVYNAPLDAVAVQTHFGAAFMEP